MRIDRTKLLSHLADIGFPETKPGGPNSKKVFIVTDKDRDQAINEIILSLPGSVRDVSIIGSSKGGIRYESFDIIIKPKNKQGISSAGKENETILINQILSRIDLGPITVKFTSGDKTWTVSEITGCQDVSQSCMSKDEKRKADLNLISGENSIPVSLKMTSAVYYEAAVSSFIKKAVPVLQMLISENKVRLLPHPDGTLGNWKIDPPGVAMLATPDEKISVAFGDDILRDDGAIIEATLTSSSFVWIENTRTLTVLVDNIIRSPAELDDVYFVIINKSKRPDFRIMEYLSRPVRGLEIRACKPRRLSSNFVIFDRHS